MSESQQTGTETAPWCGAAPGRMPGFVQPWLLLLLAEAPAHGYQLLDKLHRNPDTEGIDPGFVYRTLRQFEEAGHVRSSWDVAAPGAARRVYEITEEGVAYLHQWAEHVRGARERLDHLLQAYDGYRTGSAPEASAAAPDRRGDAAD